MDHVRDRHPSRQVVSRATYQQRRQRMVQTWAGGDLRGSRRAIRPLATVSDLEMHQADLMEEVELGGVVEGLAPEERRLPPLECLRDGGRVVVFATALMCRSSELM